MEFDHKLFATEMAGLVKEFTARALEPITARLAALEQRAPTPPQEIPILLLEPIEQRIAQLEDRLNALPAPIDGKDGKSLSPEDVAPIIVAEIRKAIDLIPVPKDGEPGTVGPAGKDGINIAGAVIDRDGNLILTLSNGEQRSLGCVVGKDGAAGTDGAPGRDGVDGLGFDDLNVEYDGERTFTFKMERGEEIKTWSFQVPTFVYRGAYKSETEYLPGDAVTYAGSLFIAHRATSARPETNDEWQLAVKRGRDGKNGKDGAEGKPGPEGRPGRDLTQMTLAGEKY